MASKPDKKTPEFRALQRQMFTVVDALEDVKARDMGRYGQIWADLGRSGEIWGDRTVRPARDRGVGRVRERASRLLRCAGSGCTAAS